MPTPSANKSRGWCFTINNYTDLEYNRLQYVACQYIVYGREVGESGTPHLQGYIHFKEKVTMGKIKSLIGTRAHVEKRFGSLEQAINYCKKDGNWTQRGNITIRSKPENKHHDLIQLAEQGHLETIKEEYPLHYFLHYDKILRLIERDIKPLDGELEHEWWYGPTGTGKSMKAWKEYPDHYPKPLNKWWDGYNFQEVVVIEEWSPKNECSASNLKIWADRYPFTGEVKGSSIQKIRPKKIIVTSNYTIKECFPNEQDWEPLMRRFKMVHFPFTSQVARDEPTEPEIQPPPAFHPDFDLLENLDINQADFEALLETM